MAIFDRRLIDPTQNELAEMLGKAMKSANRDNLYQGNRITRDAAFWSRFAQDVLRGGPEGRRRSCKGGRTVPEVVTGWWTDPAGRKHMRIIGRTRISYSRSRSYGLRRESDMRALPPWWHVYPEAVLGVRGKKEGERYLAVCRCGAVGSPESLGWMGDTCGPCFDRRAEGGSPSGGYGQFGGWTRGNSRFCFTADAKHLIGQNLSGAFWKVSRDDGTATIAKRKSLNQIHATASSAAGTTLVTADGSVYRWLPAATDIERTLPNRQFWGRVAIAPEGSRVVLLDYQHAHLAELTAERPKYTRLAPAEGFAFLHFMPDGMRLVGVTNQGELRNIHSTTMRSEVIRRDVFEGLDYRSSPPSEMVVTRDGSAALIRREQYQPYRAMVRHVPLPEGKVVELRVPEWHRPTALAYSPDGRHAVTAEAEGGWVGFWDVSNGKSLGFVRAVLEDVAWRSGQIEFSPDGGALAVSYNAGRHDHGSTVAVWPWPDTLQAASGGD